MINVLIPMEVMNVCAMVDTAGMLPMDYVKVYNVYCYLCTIK